VCESRCFAASLRVLCIGRDGGTGGDLRCLWLFVLVVRPDGGGGGFGDGGGGSGS